MTKLQKETHYKHVVCDNPPRREEIGVFAFFLSPQLRFSLLFMKVNDIETESELCRMK